MSKQQQGEPETKVKRVKLTARVSLSAYDAIREIQQQHRRKTGGHQPLWRIVDTAIRAYAKQKGIKVGA